MKNRAIAAVLTVAFAVPLFAAPAATAATEVGSNCAANSGTGGYTMVQLAQAGSPLPLTAPTAGVATKWKVNTGLKISPGFAVSETMRVLRPTGTPNQFQTIAESSPGIIVNGNGSNVFDTRIPVQAGDRFGAYAPEESSAVLFCMTSSEADVLGVKKSRCRPGVNRRLRTCYKNSAGPVGDDRAGCGRRRLRR